MENDRDRDYNRNYDRDYDENDNPDLGAQGAKTQGHGTMDKMSGKVQEGWGKLTNDDSDVVKGKMKQGKGDVEEGVGKAERKTNDALDS